MFGQSAPVPDHNKKVQDHDTDQGRAEPGQAPALLARRAGPLPHHRQALERHRPPPRRPRVCPSPEVPLNDRRASPNPAPAPLPPRPKPEGDPSPRGRSSPRTPSTTATYRPPTGGGTRRLAPVPSGVQPRARHLLRRPTDLSDRPTPARHPQPAHLQTRHGPLRRCSPRHSPTLPLLLLSTKVRLTPPCWSVV